MHTLVANPRCSCAVRAVLWGVLKKPPGLAQSLFDWLTGWRLRRGLLLVGSGLYMVASQLRPGPWLIWSNMLRVITDMFCSFTGGQDWLVWYGATVVIFGLVLPSVLIRLGFRTLEGPDLRLFERHMYRSLRRQRRLGHVIEVHPLVFDGIRAEVEDRPLPLSGVDEHSTDLTLRDLASRYFQFVAGYGFLALHLGAHPDPRTREDLEGALMLVGRGVVVLEDQVMTFARQWADEDEAQRQELMRADAACVPRLG